MDKIFKAAFVVIFVMLVSEKGYGQQALLRYADKEYELLHYQESAEAYERAFKKRGKYPAAKGAALSHEKMNDYSAAYEWWQKVIGFEQSTTDDYVHFAATANNQGKLEEVLAALDTLPDREGLDALNLDSLMYWYNESPKQDLQPMEALNSSAADFGLVEDGRGNKYFTSDRGNSGNSKKSALRFDVSGKMNEDFYEWTGRDFLHVYKADTSGSISSLDVPVPDSYHFADPFFTEGGDVVFYTVTRKVKRQNGKKIRPAKRVNPEMDYGQGAPSYIDYHAELYFSHLNDKGEFTDYQPVPWNDAIGYSVITPFVDEEARMLYFASDMPGGHGGYDIYAVSFDEDFNFGTVQNLGEVINSPEDERDPFMKDDTFYFSSNGHFGLGGFDLFSANHKDENFSALKNLGLPYNSVRDDFGITLAEGGQMYLSSDRSGGSGLDDIYTIQAMLMRFLGRVVNCEGALVSDGFMAEMIKKDEQRALTLDQETAGEIQRDLEPGEEYTLKISKRGYFPVYDGQIKAEAEDGLVEREYTLVPIPYQRTVFVDLVYYDLDKAVIRSDAMAVLDKVAELMASQSYLDLQVRSHTDARASNEYNETLSNSRADAVAAYLEGKGISSERVHEAWYGEEELINDCGDGQPCPEWKHQLNRRSELVLMAFSEEGKEYELPADLKDLCDEPNLGVTMDVPTIYFDFDQYTLRPTSVSQLDRVALLMKERPEVELALAGHTDIRGSESYNEVLSEHRAEVVRDYLIKLGIDAERISYKWYGKTQPVHDCSEQPCSEADHQLNRRTEIMLMLDGLNINEAPAPMSGGEEAAAMPLATEEIYLISGVFSTVDNASKHLDGLGRKGFAQAKYFYNPDDQLFYCYVTTFDSFHAASKGLEQYKSDGLENVWVKKM
ncbi:OmpA family protein [Echinicola strongylocentroti]|nr:OmpA family protein [Echinicola strongylocentroti]